MLALSVKPAQPDDLPGVDTQAHVAGPALAAQVVDPQPGFVPWGRKRREPDVYLSPAHCGYELMRAGRSSRCVEDHPAIAEHRYFVRDGRYLRHPMRNEGHRHTSPAPALDLVQQPCDHVLAQR